MTGRHEVDGNHINPWGQLPGSQMSCDIFKCPALLNANPSWKSPTSTLASVATLNHVEHGIKAKVS